jgi:hypothetical protein
MFMILYDLLLLLLLLLLFSPRLFVRSRMYMNVITCTYATFHITLSRRTYLVVWALKK